MKEVIHYEQRTCDQCGKQAKNSIEPKMFGIFDPFPGWVEVIERSANIGMGKGHIFKDYCSVKCHVDAMLLNVVSKK